MSQRVGGYLLGRSLASDALTDTYEALGRDERGHERAVRVCVPNLPGEIAPELLERFDADAKLAATLEHEHVGPILDHGVERGVPYVVLPPSEARSLRELLEEAEGKRLPAELVALIGLHAARALEHSHARKLVHRGVWPEMLSIEADGRVRLEGLALRRLVITASQNHSHLLEHTCRYCSPEDAMSGGTPTLAADVFALGATLYEALAGRPAFGAPTPVATVLKVSMGQLDPLHEVVPDAPRPLVDVISGMLAQDPEARPRARDLVSAFQAIVRREAPARAAIGRRASPSPPPATAVVQVHAGAAPIAPDRHPSFPRGPLTPAHGAQQPAAPYSAPPPVPAAPLAPLAYDAPPPAPWSVEPQDEPQEATVQDASWADLGLEAPLSLEPGFAGPAATATSFAGPDLGPPMPALGPPMPGLDPQPDLPPTIRGFDPPPDLGPAMAGAEVSPGPPVAWARRCPPTAVDLPSPAGAPRFGEGDWIDRTLPLTACGAAQHVPAEPLAVPPAEPSTPAPIRPPGTWSALRIAAIGIAAIAIVVGVTFLTAWLAAS